MKRRLLLVAMLLASSGCVDLAQRYERPIMPINAEYATENQPAGSVPGAYIGWRQFFDDPRLKALIDVALLNNRDLQVATARIAEARAQYRIQHSERLPNLGLGGSATRSRQPLGAGLLGATTSGGGEGVNVPTSITLNNYELSVGVSSFELDFWGRVRNLSKAAKADFLSTIAAQRSFRLSLISDVARSYFMLLETSERIAIARDTLDSRQQELKIAKRRLDSGVTSELDYRQSEALLTQAETELAGQQLALARSRNALMVLTGGPVAATLPKAYSLRKQGLFEDVAAGLPSDLLLNRPDIIGAEFDLLASRASIGVARAAFFPNISLTGSAGYASSDLSDLIGEDGFAWSWGPSLNLPLFDWGRRKASLNVARAREVASVASYEKAIQTAFREVSDALAGRRWYAKQVAAQERNLKALERIAYLARLRYREGTAEYLEVLDAERNLFSGRQSLVQLQRQQAENYVALYVALGGDVGN